MIIYPAIDILGGKVVRLLKGDYGKAENYSLTCVEAALNFKAQGASHIHAVDLDGAKSGKPRSKSVYFLRTLSLYFQKSLNLVL